MVKSLSLCVLIFALVRIVQGVFVMDTATSRRPELTFQTYRNMLEYAISVRELEETINPTFSLSIPNCFIHEIMQFFPQFRYTRLGQETNSTVGISQYFFYPAGPIKS